MNIYNSATTYSLNAFLNKVFIWMGVRMSITAIISYLFSIDASLISLLATDIGMTGLGYVVMLAPIAFALLMSVGFKRFSYFTHFIFAICSHYGVQE